MKPIATILILAGMAGATWADLPEVDDTYFHPGASLYIHGETTTASNLVAKGLSVYPEDKKLQQLMELIKQQQKQDQQNQDQQKQDQDQNNQDQDQQKQDQDQDQNNQDQQNQDQQNNQQDQQKQDQQQEQNPDNPQNQDQQQEQQAQPQRAEEMTKDEAQQLLDAMKQDEKNKRMLMHPVMGAPVKVDKDW